MKLSTMGFLVGFIVLTALAPRFLLAGAVNKTFTVTGQFSGYLYTCSKEYAINTLKRDFDTLVFDAEEKEGCLDPSTPVGAFQCVGSCPDIDYGIAKCRRSYTCKVSSS